MHLSDWIKHKNCTSCLYLRPERSHGGSVMPNDFGRHVMKWRKKQKVTVKSHLTDLGATEKEKEP